MNWKLEYLPEAEKDLKDLNGMTAYSCSEGHQKSSAKSTAC